MIIKIRRDGGLAYFPEMNAVKTLDTEALPENEKQYVEELIAKADLGRPPETFGARPKGAADMQMIVLTLLENGLVHQVRIFEPVKDQELSSLIDYLLNRSAL